MNIRKKVLLIMSSIVLFFIFALYYVSESTWMSGFLKVEDEAMKNHILRAKHGIDDNIDFLSRFAKDWGAWDDTYQFITDTNQKYIEDNLNLQTISNLRLNLLVYIDLNGEIKYAKAFDYENLNESPMPDRIDKIIKDKKDFFADIKIDSKLTGIILLNEGPMLIGARPISDSKVTQSPRGTLLVGRYLNEQIIKEISDQAQLPISIIMFDDLSSNNELKQLKEHFTKTDQILLTKLNGNIEGYALFKDIFENPALIAKVSLSRNIYTEAQSSRHYFIIALAVIGLLLLLTVTLTIQRSVLSRIKNLGDFVNHIRNKGDLTRRISIKGTDEIENLSENINGMLDSIANSEKTLKKHDRILEAISKSMNILMIESGTDEAFTEAFEIIGRVLDVGCICVFENQTDPISLKTISTRKYHWCVKPEGAEELQQQNEIFEDLLGKWSERLLKGLSTTEMLIFGDQTRSILMLPILLNKKLWGVAVFAYTYEREWAGVEKDALMIMVSGIGEMIERKRTQESIAAMGQAKLEFTSLISHELRTPLSSIKEAIALVLDEVEGKINEAQRSALSIAKGSVERLNNLISNILDFTKLEAKKMDMYFQNVNVNELINEVFMLMKHGSHAKGIELKMGVPTVPVYTVCDMDRIRQVIINLLNNSIKFTNEGGKIDLNLYHNAKKIIIEVSDNGVGIDQETMNRLFQPFSQATKMSRKHGGTGLGLTISKEIANLHNGDITVESEPGKGSRFILSFPDDLELSN